MPKLKLINVTEAQQFADKKYGVYISRPTIIKYIDTYGHQLGGKNGKYAINKEKFKRWLNGKKKTQQYKSDSEAS